MNWFIRWVIQTIVLSTPPTLVYAFTGSFTAWYILFIISILLALIGGYFWVGRAGIDE